MGAAQDLKGVNESNWDLMDQVLTNVKNAGIVVITSAGNDGPECNSLLKPPAMLASSFSVGATTDVDEIAPFSSIGPVTSDGSFRLKPEIVAPGVSIASSFPDDRYGTASGTSAAGPFVAAVVALMIEAHPPIAGNVALIESILKDSALPLNNNKICGDFSPDVIPNHTFGYGRLDALAAVQAVMTISSNTSISEHTPFVISPVPFDDFLSIQVEPNLRGPIHFSLYDGLGRVIFNQKRLSPNSNTLGQLSSLSEGIYYYQMDIAGKQFSGKISRLAR